MWIKYGSNRIGSWAHWVDAAKLPPPAPQKTFKDRYLSVQNDTGEDIKVTVQAYVPDGSGWKWSPSDPAVNQKGWTFNVSKSKTIDLKAPGSTKFLRARKARIWATSLDGKRSWLEHQTQDLKVSSTYKAASRKRLTNLFSKPQTPPPSPEEVLKDAHNLRTSGQLAAAREKFVLFGELYPDDARALDARFWKGWTENEEALYWPAIWSFYDLIVTAPVDHVRVAHSFYFTGNAYAHLGYCGYAVRNLEVVAYGNVVAAPEWVQAAKDMITWLNNDDGTTCQNWD
jgi:hypothetical protein